MGNGKLLSAEIVKDSRAKKGRGISMIALIHAYAITRGSVRSPGQRKLNVSVVLKSLNVPLFAVN